MIKALTIVSALAMLVVSGAANAAEDSGPAKANQLAKDCRWWDTNNYGLYNGEAFTELFGKCKDIYSEKPESVACEYEVYAKAAAYGYCLGAGWKFHKKCSYEDLQAVAAFQGIIPFPVPVPRVGAQACLAVCGCVDR